MERRINKKVQSYLQDFKSELVKKIQEEKTEDLVNFIYNYDKIEIEKEDFIKRKRVKNCVPVAERCCAKRANNEQCTRRRKANCNFCGTHSKGTPNGIVNDNSDSTIENVLKKELMVVDLKGIVYYIDNDRNVYNTADVLSNRENPSIVAHYEKHGEEYIISSFV